MDKEPSTKRRIRKDGWTVERQLRFLATLHSTRSVTAAAGAAGMSRESAYRLCNRPENRLFAALWDLALQADHAVATESHGALLTTGRLMRLLGNHYRRRAGGFFPSSARAKKSA